MTSSNSRYVLLALVSTLSLYSGCQKLAHHGIKGKLGAVTPVAVDQAQAEQKVTDAIAANKSTPQCTAPVISQNTALKAEIEKANQMVKDAKDLDADGKKVLTDESTKVKTMATALMNEMVKQTIASCGTTDVIRLTDIRKSTNALYVLIADTVKTDTPESTIVRQGQKQADEVKKSDSLVKQTFQLSKRLAEVLTEADKQKVLFVTSGSFFNTKENYDRMMEDTTATVCLFVSAPTVQLAENASVSVIGASLNVEEKQTDSKDQTTSAIEKTTTLVVQLSSAGQKDKSGELMSFSCRLGSELTTASASAQFSTAFGTLLTQAPAKTN